MLSGNGEANPIGRIRDVKILNAVLESSEAAGFPDFSNDGQYLKFLHIDSVIRHIGSREDDYINAFTARMLMLLEAKYLYNEGQFNEFRMRIIRVYFSDFHRHSQNFKPIFLINDVLRFWRTLCINYENSRHWRGIAIEENRAKGHLDNLKLKFSRLSICYSFICHLLHQGKALNAESAISTAALTPFERFSEIAEKSGDLREIVVRMRAEYEWFLDAVSRPKQETLDWIDDRENRDFAFEKASKFIDLVGTLTKNVADKNDYTRYLIV